MNKKLKISLLTAILVLIGAISIYTGFYYIMNKEPIEKPNIKANIEEVRIDNDIISEEIKIVENPIEEPKINENTTLIYEYYYTLDGKIDYTKEEAPYFLLYKTEPELKEIFPEWEIISFKENEIKMRKTIEGTSNQYYIIGVLDGYVAVFYKNEINGSNLKEITDTAVGTLPLEEQEKLIKGIEVAGEEELIKILEDYGS